jgi:hypothetical protein
LHGFLRVVNAMSELLQFLLKVKENLWSDSPYVCYSFNLFKSENLFIYQTLIIEESQKEKL